MTTKSGSQHAKKEIANAGNAEGHQKVSTKAATGNCLQILPDEGKSGTNRKKVTDLNSRPVSSGSPGRKAPPVNRTHSATSARTPTPTKHVALHAARRKEDCTDISSPEATNESLPQRAALVTSSSVDVLTTNPRSLVTSEKLSTVSKGNKKCSREAVGDHESDDDDSSTDEEPVRAPNELMMEFLECVMNGDYANAQKLCKMILIYEPNNAEALNFQPLIEEKIALDKTAQNENAEDSQSESDSDSEDEDDDSDNTSSEDDSKVARNSRNSKLPHHCHQKDVS